MTQDEIKRWLYEPEWDLYGIHSTAPYDPDNPGMNGVLESLARQRMLMEKIYSYFIDLYAKPDDNCPTDVIEFIAELGAELEGLPREMKDESQYPQPGNEDL